MTAAVLACGVITALCVGPGAPMASASANDITAEPELPGANLGGDLVYDGFGDKNISRFGLYGMVYHLDTLTQQECATEEAKPVDEIDAFDREGKTNKYYLREKGEFEPTGSSITLQPQGELSVSSSESKTRSWSVSVAVEKELGIKWIGKLKVTITGTYGQEVTTSTTDTATAKNPTHNMVQDWAYGIFSDVWAVQVRPWTVSWRKAGAQIFVGDDPKDIVNWYKVKDAGCYRTGYFSTLSMARSKGHGIVRQYPVESNKKCPHRISGEEVKLYPGKKDPNGGTKPDLKGKTVEIDEGTCVTISGKAPQKGEGESKWVELAKVRKDNNGRCQAVPKQLCADHYWVRSTEISEVNVKPTPLEKWGNGDQFVIRNVTEPGGNLGSLHPFITNWIYYNSASSEKWKLINNDNGYWQLQNVGGEGAKGKCVSYGKVGESTGNPIVDGGVIENCANRDSQKMKVIFAGQGSFYLQAKQNTNKCLHALQNNEGAYTDFVDCKSGDNRQRWTFAKG
jgi:hypothetical protein